MNTAVDLRHIETGHKNPGEGYCDQPYVVVTDDGSWTCTMTTGVGHEGAGGQHVVATISHDQGCTWEGLYDIEPASGPEASWAMPLRAPGTGRIYAFYTYNKDNRREVRTVDGGTFGRVDSFGAYASKYSDGEVSLRTPPGGDPIAGEVNATPMNDGSLYVALRAIARFSCHARCTDDGHTWKVDWTYNPGGQCANFVRRFANGEYLYWFCFNGDDRQFGWSRFHPDLLDANGSKQATLAPTLAGTLSKLRLYNRPPLTSEAVGNWRADNPRQTA